MCGTTLGRQELHLAGPLPHAFSFRAVLDAGFEHHLQAHADAQDGPAAGHAPADEPDSVHGLELAHHRFEGTHAGDHEAVSVEHVLGLGAEEDLGTGAFEGPDGRADVA